MAGNYGKAFAYASKKLGLNHCTVAMPDTAPQNRRELIKSYGVTVECVQSANLSMHVKQVIFQSGMLCQMHFIIRKNIIFSNFLILIYFNFLTTLARRKWLRILTPI